jgi:hypothetical protein
MSRLSRKTIIENTVSYCEKNKNKFALEQLMNISELFCRVYGKEDKGLPDTDIDRTLTILAVLRCKDERALSNIHLIVKQIVDR